MMRQAFSLPPRKIGLREGLHVDGRLERGWFRNGGILPCHCEKENEHSAGGHAFPRAIEGRTEKTTLLGMGF